MTDPCTPDDAARPFHLGFNFTAHMRRLCADMAARLDELSHIDVEQIAFAFSQVRKAGDHGLWATLTPMRFEGGALETSRAGQRYSVQRLYDGQGREMLYILTFYLPRFLNLPLEDKLTTVLHELWHISPQFDGDIRRHSGRCAVHTGSQAQYDAAMRRLAARWLSAGPAESLYEFLRWDFVELRRRFGRVYGSCIRRPKLIPLGHPPNGQRETLSPICGERAGSGARDGLADPPGRVENGSPRSPRPLR